MEQEAFISNYVKETAYSDSKKYLYLIPIIFSIFISLIISFFLIITTTYNIMIKLFFLFKVSKTIFISKSLILFYYLFSYTFTLWFTRW